MFKPRPYDPDREDNRTAAQKAASDRNFRIFKLRGLHAQVRLLTGKRKEQAMKLVDQELAAMGAETEAKRTADRRAKLAAMQAEYDIRVDPLAYPPWHQF